MEKNDRKIIYKLRNISGEECRRSIEKRVKALDGVDKATCNLEFGFIEAYIDEWTSEYDIMRSIIDIVDDCGAEVDLNFNPDSDDVLEKDSENEDEDSGEQDEEFPDMPSESPETESENDDKETDEDEKDKDPKKIAEEINRDRTEAEEEKKPLIKKFLSPLIEISVALIAFLVSLIFFKNNQKVGGIICVLAFSVAGYEIIWDCFASMFQKKFISVELLYTLASVGVLLCGYYYEATALMLVLRSISVLDEFIKTLARQKAIDTYYFKDEMVDLCGEETESVPVFTVEEGRIVAFSEGNTVSLDGTVVEGGGEVDGSVYGLGIFKVKKDDHIKSGFKLVSGDIKVKVTKKFENSFAYKEYKKAVCEDAQTCPILKKSLFLSTYILLGIGLIIAFIIPLFYIGGKGYSEALFGYSDFRGWLYLGCLILALSGTKNIYSAIDNARALLFMTFSEKKIILPSEEIIDKIDDSKRIVFDCKTILGETAKIKKIAATEEYNGKLADIANEAFSVFENCFSQALSAYCGKTENKAKLSEQSDYGFTARCGKDEIVVGTNGYLKGKGINTTETNESGLKQYLAVNGCFAGVIVFSEYFAYQARGAVKELKVLNDKQLFILGGNAFSGALSEALKIDGVILESDLRGEDVLICGDDREYDCTVIKFNGGLMDRENTVKFYGDEFKDVPQLVKRCRRYKHICYQNMRLSFSFKVIAFVAGVLCSLFGAGGIWIAIVIELFAFLLISLNAFRSKITAY